MRWVSCLTPGRIATGTAAFAPAGAPTGTDAAPMQCRSGGSREAGVQRSPPIATGTTTLAPAGAPTEPTRPRCNVGAAAAAKQAFSDRRASPPAPPRSRLPALLQEPTRARCNVGAAAAAKRALGDRRPSPPAPPPSRLPALLQNHRGRGSRRVPQCKKTVESGELWGV